MLQTIWCSLTVLLGSIKSPKIAILKLKFRVSRQGWIIPAWIFVVENSPMANVYFFSKNFKRLYKEVFQNDAGEMEISTKQIESEKMAARERAKNINL